MWEGISGKSEKDWIKYIAWSNIYKVAPDEVSGSKDTGNPTNAMCKKQIEVCRKILKKEIDIYNPTHILFITGFDGWFNDVKGVYGVSEIFTNISKTGNRNKCRGEFKNEIYVEETASYNNAKVVIACRPERRNEDKYVEEVLKAFK